MHDSKLPYVFFHRGKLPKYLIYSLRQCRVHAGEGLIYIVTDQHHPIFGQLNIICVSFDSLESERHQQFSSNYKHFSSNDPAYEKFCFSRWFYLSKLMQKEGFHQCIHLDSDCLVFAPSSTIFDKFSSRPITVGRDGFPHCCIVKTSLDPWLSYIESYFEDALFEKWKSMKNTFVSNGSSWTLSDMNLFRHYVNEKPEEASTAPTDKAGLIECNMNESEGYELWPGRKSLKRIFWQVEESKLIPYVKNLNDDKYYRCYALHFKGGAKRRMNRYQRKANCPECILRTQASWYNVIPPINILK